MPRFVTFTPNPALDVSTSVERLVHAHKLRCDAAQQHPGGGGINVARVLHRLGAQVLAIYPAGGPTGQRLHASLQAEGVPDLPLPMAGETRENFTVYEREREQEFRFVLPGPTLSAAEWSHSLDTLRQQHPTPAWLISSGRLPPGVADDGHAQVARIARAIGARMVLDSSGPALTAALQEGVWLVKPSLRELVELSGIDLPTRRSQREAAQRLIAQGRAQWVALTLGNEGAMLVGPDQCLLADALAVPVASSVGAGDSFLAGLVWALDQGHDGPTALAHAMAAGAAAVMVRGTALCQPEQVDRLRQQVQIKICA
ncbi:MAG: 1-phosphofructokinase family hexose kinase [Betaproteobacteria bacterium]|nr:1-phosphofructokinase family hexose kinase [Betaproteobacteria bacterium]